MGIGEEQAMANYRRNQEIVIGIGIGIGKESLFPFR